jgi:hypothetical protein
MICLVIWSIRTGKGQWERMVFLVIWSSGRTKRERLEKQKSLKAPAVELGSFKILGIFLPFRIMKSFGRAECLSGTGSKTDAQDQGPEEGKKKGVGRDLDVSFYDTMKHQGQNAHQAT